MRYSKFVSETLSFKLTESAGLSARIKMLEAEMAEQAATIVKLQTDNTGLVKYADKARTELKQAITTAQDEHRSYNAMRQSFVIQSELVEKMAAVMPPELLATLKLQIVGTRLSSALEQAVSGAV